MRLLNTSGHKCPIPVLLTRRLLKEMAVGEQVKVLATDPESEQDMPRFCAEEGHRMIEQVSIDNHWAFVIEKQETLTMSS